MAVNLYSCTSNMPIAHPDKPANLPEKAVMSDVSGSMSGRSECSLSRRAMVLPELKRNVSLCHLGASHPKRFGLRLGRSAKKRTYFLPPFVFPLVIRGVLHCGNWKSKADCVEQYAAALFLITNLPSMSSGKQLIRDEVMKVLQDVEAELVAVYQFGSTVRGDENDASDLDLAILAHRPLPNLERWDLQEEIAVQIHRDVDLVDLRSASTVMQMQVVATGIVIAKWDRTARQEFEMHTSSAYALLNEERASILDDIQARGQIYG